jgi:hypothetical protein
MEVVASRMAWNVFGERYWLVQQVQDFIGLQVAMV